MPSVDQNRRQAINRFHRQSSQLLSDSELQLLYKVLKDYQRHKRIDRLVRGLQFIVRSSPEKLELLRYVRNIIPRYHVQEYDTLMLQQSVRSDRSPTTGKRVHLGVGSLGRHSPTCSNDQLFDAHEVGAETTIIAIQRDHGDNSLGFCIRGGSEHGLGIYVSELERGSVADVAGLEVGDKILEVNNISLKNIASSSAVKVLTGSNHLKLMVEKSGKIPEWRFSREKTTWYDSAKKKLISGDFEEFGTMHFIRGLDEIPERRVTLSSTKHNRVLGFNIRGGSEYGLGIYVSSIDQGSIAEGNGVRVGDQLIDVNGIPFDNITHVHAVEIIKNQTHLILTLRDVGRYPAYKELYAEYTWSSGKRRTRVHIDHLGNKLQETKLTDMWIETDEHISRPGLHLKVPVEVLSSVNHSHSDIYDSVNQSDEGRLQTEIYLPNMENDENVETLQGAENKSDHGHDRDDLDSVNLDMYTKNGGGLDNPSYIHESTQSLAGSDSESAISDTDDESGIHGEYSLTMDDIIARADNLDGKNEYKGESSKMVTSQIMDTTNVSTNISINQVDSAVLVLQPNTFESESIDLHNKNMSEPMDSEPVLGDKAVHVLRSNWADSSSEGGEDPNKVDTAVHVLRPNWTESSAEKHENIPDILPVSANGADKLVDQQNFELFEVTHRTEVSTKPVSTEIKVTSAESAALNSSSHSTPVKAKLIVQENVISSVSYPSSSSAMEKPGTSSSNRRPSVEFHELSDSENERFMSQNFSERIKDLESRQANIGMMELKTLSADKKSPSKNKGSLKRSKWKSIKDKFMGSLRMKLAKRESVTVRKEGDYYGSIGRKKGVFESAFSPQMVHHNTIDSHSMSVLDDAARKLLESDEMNAVMKHLQSYHETRDLDRLVEVLLAILDKPEKMLLLRDIRSVLYPVHMNRFDDMVNSHEVEAYEILSTRLHEQLRQDKNRKPKKHLLTTEVDDHGHFHIKSMDPLERRRNSENIIIEMKDERSTNTDELILSPSALLIDRKKEFDDSTKGSEGGSSLTSAESFSKQGTTIAYVSKIKPTLGLCVSGGSDSKKQPVVKVDQVINGGAAADEPRIQPGLIIVSVDGTKLLGASHTDAVAALKKSFSNKRRVTMRVVLKKDEITEEKC